MDILLISVILIAVLVFAAAVRDCSFSAIKRIERPSIIVTLPVGESSDDIEMTVRSLVSSLEKSGVGVQKLFLLDTGTSEDTASVCKLLCRENCALELVNNEEICIYFSQRLKSESENDIIDV